MEMKVLFEDVNATELKIGISSCNKLEIDMDGNKIELPLSEAYQLEKAISGYIRDIEDVERKKLPLWKRISR